MQVCPVNIFQGINTLLAKYLDLNPVNSFAVKIADLSVVKKAAAGIQGVDWRVMKMDCRYGTVNDYSFRDRKIVPI